MILRRFRSAAPTIMAGGLSVLCAMTSFAQASGHVRTDQQAAAEHADLKVWVIVTFLSFSAVILAGIAGAYALLSSSRDRAVEVAVKANRESVAANAEQIAEILAMMREHHADPAAHPAGSAARIDPINEKLDSLASGQHAIAVKLARLVAEHTVIRRTELCLMNAANLAKRDPSDSPHPRRATDPEGVDFTDARGKGDRAPAREDDEVAGDEEEP